MSVCDYSALGYLLLIITVIVHCLCSTKYYSVKLIVEPCIGFRMNKINNLGGGDFISIYISYKSELR